MSDANFIKAKSVFDTICGLFDSNNWKYSKDEENLRIEASFSGEDLSMKTIFLIRPDKQLVTMFSPLPFNIAEDKRVDAAIAVAIANYGLVNGTFDYDLSDGEIRFRIVAPFMDSTLSASVFEYMIRLLFNTVDNYNDRFLMLSKGMITLEKFVELENN